MESGTSRAAEGRRRRSDAQRNIDAIVSAALEMLAERPGASMQELADAAGVHRATVHRHFATRDDLLRAVRERGLDELQDVLEDAGLLSGRPVAALARVTRQAVLLGDRQRLYRVTTVLDGASEARARALTAPMIALFRRAQAAGDARGDRTAEELALAWSGLVLVTLPQIARGALTPDDAVRFVLAFVGPAS